MRAARITHGVAVDLWEVPALDCYADVPLVAASDECGLGWGYDGAVFTPPIPSPLELVKEAARKEAKDEKDAVKTSAFTRVLLEMNPAQADNYVDDKVSNLADAKKLLGDMLRVLVVLTKREFES